MDKVAGSGNDEFYTPLYAVEPILKYLKPHSTIWCPFDTKKSNFYKLLKQNQHTVYCTHIDNEEDFFTTDPIHGVDYIISNPPYSKKGEVLQRLFDLKIPFAMLVGVVGLFESQKRFQMFKNNSFEILYLDKRISYFKCYEEQKPSLNPPFSSVYVCSGILPSQICFNQVDKNFFISVDENGIELKRGEG